MISWYHRHRYQTSPARLTSETESTLKSAALVPLVSCSRDREQRLMGLRGPEGGGLGGLVVHYMFTNAASKKLSQPLSVILIQAFIIRFISQTLREEKSNCCTSDITSVSLASTQQRVSFTEAAILYQPCF